MRKSTFAPRRHSVRQGSVRRRSVSVNGNQGLIARRGSSLLELVVTMGLVTAMAGVAVSALHSVFSLEKMVSGSSTDRQVFLKLGRMLREDVRGASAVDWKAEERQITMDMADSRVVYRVDDRGIYRNEIVAGQLARNELFRIPGDVQLEIEVDPDRQEVTGRLERRKATSDQQMPAGTGRELVHEWHVPIGRLPREPLQ